ncbi:DNA polymerase III subunit beta [Patescibacteria group bacterium]|nr:DNA polymerase III subunit beta [Patescibacteria group bacterium]
MRFVFLTENLQKKLSFLNHAISGRSSLPILSNFLLEAKKGKLRISATDLEIGVIVETPANIEEEGEITIPAKTFSDLLSNIDEEKITIKLVGTNLDVKGKKMHSVFQTMPAEEFPKLYENKGQKIGTIKRKIIEEEFPRVVFSASQDSGRPALSGVLMSRGDKGLEIVATDGYRLSLKKGLAVDLKAEGESGTLLVPARVIREVIGLKDEGEDVEVFLSKENNQVVFKQADSILIGRLIEAEYPNYAKIIPASFSVSTTFNREEMLGAVKMCSVFARETANIIKLNIDKEKIVVSANTPSVGENTVDIEAKTDGETSEIAFNARYLLEALSVLGGEEIIFEMSGPLSPGVFRIKKDPTFLHLIMPIRVQN